MRGLRGEVRRANLAVVESVVAGRYSRVAPRPPDWIIGVRRVLRMRRRRRALAGAFSWGLVQRGCRAQRSLEAQWLSARGDRPQASVLHLL